MFVDVYFGRSALVDFTLKLLALSLQDVSILPGAAAGAVGPAAVGLGAGLRAHV